MNNKIRFTTWLAPQTKQLIDDLAKEGNVTQRCIVENAIESYYRANSNRRKKADNVLLRKQLNKVQEQNEQMLSIVKFLCVALGYDISDKE